MEQSTWFRQEAADRYMCVSCPKLAEYDNTNMINSVERLHNTHRLYVYM